MEDICETGQWLVHCSSQIWRTDPLALFHPPKRSIINATANQRSFQDSADHQIHMGQLKRAELFNDRAAMLSIVIGMLTEALTGSRIAHQIGLGALWLATPTAAACSCRSVSEPHAKAQITSNP